MRAMIIRGDLAPGSPTQETKFSNALGVSRTPLREAMKLLTAEGLVELGPNRSPRIADIETDRILELFEALAGIERLAAELAAQRATERELQRLRLLQMRMESCHRDGKLDDYFTINGEIHSPQSQHLRGGEELLATAPRLGAAPSTQVIPLTAPRAKAQIAGAVVLEALAEHHGTYDAAIIAIFADPGLHGSRIATPTRVPDR